jgi:hypothetical protein
MVLSYRSIKSPTGKESIRLPFCFAAHNLEYIFKVTFTVGVAATGAHMVRALHPRLGLAAPPAHHLATPLAAALAITQLWRVPRFV